MLICVHMTTQFDKDEDKRHKLWLVNSGLRLIYDFHQMNG